ncbi:hypothetical protein SAMN05421869_10812 [Nonomuraea jiangxiensis]|uniref:Uncharacterized protein n=1 Tax=Nonomuraea jiangxiensis TaxID=633440 RepID=A0A1G8PSL2_9ACTN|nr:hypothetical protein SAMN05421869_10812 [Nonomuraea jiangxiensis]
MYDGGSRTAPGPRTGLMAEAEARWVGVGDADTPTRRSCAADHAGAEQRFEVAVERGPRSDLEGYEVQ